MAWLCTYLPYIGQNNVYERVSPGQKGVAALLPLIPSMRHQHHHLSHYHGFATINLSRRIAGNFVALRVDRRDERGEKGAGRLSTRVSCVWDTTVYFCAWCCSRQRFRRAKKKKRDDTTLLNLGLYTTEGILLRS